MCTFGCVLSFFINDYKFVIFQLMKENMTLFIQIFKYQNTVQFE